MDVIVELVFRLAQFLALAPFFWLWARGPWSKLLALTYVVGMPAGALFVIVWYTPALLPLGWLPWAVVVIWALTLVEMAFEALKDGIAWLWHQLTSGARKVDLRKPAASRPEPPGRPGR